MGFEGQTVWSESSLWHCKLGVLPHENMRPYLSNTRKHIERWYLFFFLKIYLFIRDTQKEAETQAEREAGYLQGSWCGTWSPDPGSCPEPKADTQLLSHPGVLIYLFDTERERERESTNRKKGRGTEGQGEAGSPLSKKPNVGLDPRPRDHALNQRQMLNCWATQASQTHNFQL